MAVGLLFALNVPPGCLLATILIPPTLLEYGLRVGAWMAAVTALSYLLARALRVTALVTNGLLNLGMFFLDQCRGQALLKDSLLSSFAISGHHVYGAGNAYVGLVAGYALMVVLGGQKKRSQAVDPALKVPA